jgi:hypothetical protein
LNKNITVRIKIFKLHHPTPSGPGFSLPTATTVSLIKDWDV